MSDKKEKIKAKAKEPPVIMKIGFVKEFMKNKELFFMILPPTIFIIVNNYIPMFGVVIAFQNYNLQDKFFSPWAGFKNFEFLFNSNKAWEITRNTVGYNLLFIVLILVIAVTVAIILNELRTRFLAKLYQSIIFLPYFLSWVVAAYLVYSILSPEGFFNNTVVKILNLTGIDWYTRADLWPFIIPVVHLWKTIGYSIVIYLAGISGIDQEYYEAAVLDGANKLQQIKAITIPFLVPLMIITTLIAIGNIFRTDFGLFWQVPLQQGMLTSTTETLDTYIYKTMIEVGDAGMAAAAGLYQSVVGFFLVLGANFLVSKISKENRVF